MRSAAERSDEFLAGGAALDVSGYGLNSGGREFALEVSHDFFWRDGMRGGAHRRIPFCGIACAAAGDAVGSAD